MAAIGDVAVVEQPQRPDHVTGTQVIVEGERRALRGLQVEECVLTLVERYGGELLLSGAVEVHVPAEGKSERERGIEGAVGRVLLQERLAKAVAVGLLVGAVDKQDVVGHARVQQQGSVLDHVTACSARAVDRPADSRIEAQHQADLEIVALAAVAALDE